MLGTAFYGTLCLILGAPLALECDMKDGFLGHHMQPRQ